MDSYKILNRENQKLTISDRNSHPDENPESTLGWIYYPKEDKIQFCMTIRGKNHEENVNYNIKDVNNWENIIFLRWDPEQVEKMVEYMKRDPQKLASWC